MKYRVQIEREVTCTQKAWVTIEADSPSQALIGVADNILAYERDADLNDRWSALAPAEDWEKETTVFTTDNTEEHCR